MGKWGKVNLENVCFILDSQRVPITASERIAGSYPYYGANGLQDYVNDYIFDDELVLLAEDGGNFGSKDRPIAYRVSGKCWVNNHAHVLKAKDNVNVDYLCYSLMFYDVSNLVNGATRQKLTQADMKKMVIPLPSLEEQQKIAATLDKVTDLINLRKKELERLDLLVKSRFVEMFGDPIANPKGWERNQLKDLSLKIGSGATPKGGRECYGIEGISLIRSMNVHNGIFEYKELAHISDEQAIKLDNVIVKENDVLLNITGASVARSCVVPNDVLPARVNQHVCIIRCNDLILPCFLNNLLINNRFQSLLWSIAGSGATREAITKQQVEKLQIIIPPINLQNQFSDFVTKTDKSKYAVKKSLEKLETLKKALMQEYFG